MIKPIQEEYISPVQLKVLNELIDAYASKANYFMEMKNNLIRDLNQALLKRGDVWGIMDRESVSIHVDVLAEEAAKISKELNSPYAK